MVVTTKNYEFIIVDASSIIAMNEIFEEKIVTTYNIMKELKTIENRSKALHSFLKGSLFTEEPLLQYKQKVIEKAKEIGFENKLSSNDVELIALALQKKEENKKFVVFTEDYSVQNMLKIFNIEFESVFREKIEKILVFKKICNACKKEFAGHCESKKCDFCGNEIKKKPVFL